MTPMNRWRGRLPRAAVRRLARSDDSGATLVLALIFITVVSVVIAAVLSFVDTSMRTTIAVRDEAAKAAAADAAAQIAINAIRKSGYVSGGAGSCQDQIPSSSLNGFYTQGGTTYSAAVTCLTDTDDSTGGGVGPPITSSNRPGQAILTLGQGTDGGFEAYTGGGGDEIKVKGDILSNSSITSQKSLTGYNNIKAVGACTALSGGIMTSATGSLTTTPPGPKCNLGAGAVVQDPGIANPSGYAPPSIAGLTVQSVPNCTGHDGAQVFRFEPGIYTDLPGLKALTSTSRSNRCQGSTLWFTPGTYFFNLGGTWPIDTGYVVGGTPKDNATEPPLTPGMPGSCMAPIPPDQNTTLPPPPWTRPPDNGGVELVLGGTTRISLGHGHIELCASYDSSKPPIALYGLKSAVGTVPAEPDRICAEVGGKDTNNSDSCAVIYSDNSPDSEFYVQGTTYMPKAWVGVHINNDSGQVFRYGIIVRRLLIAATGSAYLDDPVIEVPDLVNAGPSLTVLYLGIDVCAGATCPLRVRPDLEVKVGIKDPSGTPVPGQRQVTVYSWSVQRS
jgi:hypothetical protein